MDNFDWTQFSMKIMVMAPRQSIYNAWTKPEELEKWFLSEASFITSTGIPVPKNKSILEKSTYQWRWHLWDGIETGIVTRANGNNELQFTFAGQSIVDVHLEIFEEGTIVTLSQSNIPTDNDSKKNVRIGCHTGWSFYMVNLKSVYEGGLDLRNKNSNLKGMLNS